MGGGWNCVCHGALDAGDFVGDGGGEVLSAGYGAEADKGSEEGVFDEVLTGFVMVEANRESARVFQRAGAWDSIVHVAPWGDESVSTQLKLVARNEVSTPTKVAPQSGVGGLRVAAASSNAMW